ncbi:hypothetical protein BKA81DRAFT_376209 [Phyllosticta paracitricarpa]|uniref:Secreted protein n=1 Tax=Phyllosticta paracitricarpa TaxID=2016321 RepID=A0ABR1NBP7_9PEZI
MSWTFGLLRVCGWVVGCAGDRLPERLCLCLWDRKSLSAKPKGGRETEFGGSCPGSLARVHTVRERFMLELELRHTRSAAQPSKMQQHGVADDYFDVAAGENGVRRRATVRLPAEQRDPRTSH